MEYSLNLSTKVAEAAGLYVDGRAINCLLLSEASMVDLIAKAPWASQEQMEMLSANLDPSKCMAQITFTELAKGTLLNLAFGYAFEEIGWLLEDGAQGFGWRLLTEEEGSIGPRGPWNINANDPVDLEAFQRLNTLDSATGQLRPGEAGVAAELENYTGSTMQRAGAASGPDFEFTSGPYNGQTVDMMYTPSTVEQANNLNQYFNQNLPALEENLTSHASKADLVAIDMRVLSSQNQASMMNAINSLPSALQSKFILLW